MLDHSRKPVFAGLLDQMKIADRLKEIMVINNNGRPTYPKDYTDRRVAEELVQAKLVNNTINAGHIRYVRSKVYPEFEAAVLIKSKNLEEFERRLRDVESLANRLAREIVLLKGNGGLGN